MALGQTQTCPVCKGKRTVPTEIKGDDGKPKVADIQCPECKGSGVSRGYGTK
jgi:hypothetical protein